jgi:hypothetical protein
VAPGSKVKPKREPVPKVHGFRDTTLHKAGDTLSSRHVSSCDVTRAGWYVRGDLTLNSMVQVHTSVTLRMSRDLTWSSGRLTCQHACQHSSERHVSRPELHVKSRDICRVTEV